MPPKSDPEKSETEPTKKPVIVICGVRGPGPKYLLKTLVGYKEHCLSKYRNPAYTFGARFLRLKKCDGPGPKYLIPSPKHGGYSFGSTGRGLEPFCTPGPYILPTPKTPAFSLRFRTKLKGECATPGPYLIKTPTPGPAFSIGIRTPVLKCSPTPGPFAYEEKTCKASFSITGRKPERIICRSPGPIYNVKPPKPMPAYSFGVRHSECAPPYIVECDELC
ncbi:uncharacterized protein LOC117224881 [Megalopta genalis]|uniref:uncharacterized protein LOC117224881 n=1 Tax=Megalopta genalis TaxID=115081 RepID=UPI0014430BBE|nr:outer dense fiber protein 3B-like [Megalopta genalis]